MKQIALIINLCLFTLSCLSQDINATLFFKDGDSISGFGEIKKNEKIKFRVSLDRKGDLWHYDMIDKIVFLPGYNFGLEKTYQYVKLSETSPPRLLQIVTTGEITLYRDKKTSTQINPSRAITTVNPIFPTIRSVASTQEVSFSL